MKEDMMSEETFNGFEYVTTLTKYGRENIKYHIQRLQQENQELKQKYLNAVADYETTMSENKQLKDLIGTILALPFFENECPLNIGFENDSKEEYAQNIFYKDDYCENNCNDNYKDCWLKYFKELQKEIM